MIKNRNLSAVVSIGVAVTVLTGMSQPNVAVEQSPDQVKTQAVINYDRPPPTFGAPSAETWHQRGDIVRIDSEGTREGDGLRLTGHKYTRPGQPTTFTVSRFKSGAFAGLHLMRDPLTALPLNSERTYTGQVETRVNEQCRIWKRVVPINPELDFVQSGCTTRDGLELSRRQANIDAIFARTIHRREVAREEVEPPLTLLDPGEWMKGAPLGSHEKDYEIVLSSSEQIARTQTVRRSGYWELTLETYPPDKTSVQIRNDTADIIFSYSGNNRDDGQLSVTRRTSYPHSKVPWRSARKRLTDQQGKVIFGERCEWWSTAEGVSDYYRTECLTADGIALMIVATSWGTTTAMTATRFRRGPVPFSSILPPKHLVDPAHWGF